MHKRAQVGISPHWCKTRPLQHMRSCYTLFASIKRISMIKYIGYGTRGGSGSKVQRKRGGAKEDHLGQGKKRDRYSTSAQDTHIPRILPKSPYSIT